jgi:hypothetical protein
MLNFFQSHGDLGQCHAAKPLVAITDIQDAFVIEDGVEKLPNLINSEGYERICRWGYGLEKVYEHVRRVEEWKDSKKAKTQWGILKEYHPSDEESGGATAEGADLEVQKKLQQKALFNKYLEKSGALASTPG